jgi:hypothetical protein
VIDLSNIPEERLKEMLVSVHGLFRSLCYELVLEHDVPPRKLLEVIARCRSRCGYTDEELGAWAYKRADGLLQQADLCARFGRPWDNTDDTD